MKQEHWWLTKQQFDEATMIASACRTDLMAYSKFMKEDYDVQRFHEEIAEHLMAVYTGEIKRLAIEMPPRAWKSKLTCINFPSRALGNNPYAKIVVAWYWAPLTQEFSVEARDMVRSAKYKALFNTEVTTEKVDHWRTVDSQLKEKMPDEYWYYHATSIWWALTWYWGDILIVDDPVKNREEAESVVYREKIRSWYTSTLSTRFSNDQARVIVIMTRWHVDDLRGRIEKLKDQYERAWITQEPWHLITIPSLERVTSIPSYAEDEASKRKSFRPSKFSVDYLLAKRIDIWVRDFSALYQQDPISSTGQIFKPADFRYAKLSDFEMVNPREPQLYKKEHIEMRMFIDPAFSTDKDSDDASVAIMWRHRITKDIFLFDLYSWTSAPSVTIDYAFAMARKWRNRWFDNFSNVSIEDVELNKDQTQFIQTFEDEMHKRWDFYKVLRWHPKGKKDDRIKFSLEPIFSVHKLYFLDDQIPYDQMIKLTEQLQQFPNSTYKDVIDVVSQWVIVFRDHGMTEDPNKPTAPPKEKFNPMTGKMMNLWKAKTRVF